MDSFQQINDLLDISPSICSDESNVDKESIVVSAENEIGNANKQDVDHLTIKNGNNADMEEYIDLCVEDEGTESTVEIWDVSSDSQKTPADMPVSYLLCDSGFTQSLSESMNLQCLECFLELQPSSNKLCKGAVLCRCFTKEQDGFEEYVNEIYFHRLTLEEKFHVPSCLDNQPELTPSIRKELIRWLTNVHHELRLCQDTLYLAVNIIDRVLDVMQVSHDCLELLGITCLLVASKQNEICPSEIQQLLEKCHDQFTREQVKQLEMIVLMATNFDLMVPTVQQFLEYYVSFCSAMSVDKEHIHRLKMACAVGRCVLELSLQEYRLCSYRPSLLALCVWKVAVSYMKTYDGDFFPAGITVSKQKYDQCLTDVRSFVDSYHDSSSSVTSFWKKYLISSNAM